VYFFLCAIYGSFHTSFSLYYWYKKCRALQIERGRCFGLLAKLDEKLTGPLGRYFARNISRKGSNSKLRKPNVRGTDMLAATLSIDAGVLALAPDAGNAIAIFEKEARFPRAQSRFLSYISNTLKNLYP
jgi:hypothetical protein